jgi:hypothetical protein
MRLTPEAQLPRNPDSPYSKALDYALKMILRSLIQKLNALADGQISAIDNAATSAPTTGTYRQGDFIRNSTPTEQGVAGSKYVTEGWTCVSGGAPGTWVQKRFLTGN